MHLLKVTEKLVFLPLRSVECENAARKLANSAAELGNAVTGLDNLITRLANSVTGLDNLMTGIANAAAGITNSATGIANCATAIVTSATGIDNLPADLANLEGYRRRERVNLGMILLCPHCQTNNAVNKCSRCARHFIISHNRLIGLRRTFNDKAVMNEPSTDIQLCDFCLSIDDKVSTINQINAGLTQKTCANCRTEMLSYHGIDK